MQEILEQIQQFLGVGADTLTWYQTAIRAVIVYAAALMMVRVGEKRFMGKNTAFDVILGIILGSVVSRAINSVDAIFPTILAGFILVGLHWSMAAIAFRSDRFGDVIKGSSRQLIREGVILWDEMAKSHISEQDLRGQIRAEASTEDFTGVEKAILERSGKISVIKSGGPPKVLEVKVEEGVQTIRIVLES